MAQDQDSQKHSTGLEIKLRRLLKGTLFIGIASGYIAMIGFMFVTYGWQLAVMALALVVLSLLLRFVSDEVYRVGLVFAQEQSSMQVPSSSRTLQKRLYWLILTLVHLPLIGLATPLIRDAQEPDGVVYWLASLGVLWVVIEASFIWIRKVNKQISYGLASFGIRDNSPLGLLLLPTGARTQEDRSQKLEAKIEQLKVLHQAGKLSQKAFEKQRDKLRIRQVMEADD